MKTKRRSFVLCRAIALLLLTVLVCTSCRMRSDRSAAELLSAICAVEAGIPAGRIYYLGAEEGEEGYLSDSLCTALYGDRGVPSEFALLSDYAIFLTATDHPCELAVFRCFSGSDTVEIAELCEKRLQVLRQYWRESDYARYTSGGRTVILGNYVLFLVSSDPEAAVDAVRELLAR